jgi:Zn-dependent peptidase ImmA (M78 family)/DNA-binding XRE family transcriptional regulator
MSGTVPGRRSVLPKVIPERIREAREARGFSAEELADRIGVTKQAVSQYEIGQTSPSADVLSHIMNVTEQPPSFFVLTRRRKSDGFRSPFWRSLKRMEQLARARISRRLEWAADIVDYIEDYVELPVVGIPDLQWDEARADDDDIEEIALRVRKDWSLGFGPIHNLAALLEHYGCILIRERVNCEEMDAVSRWQGGRPYILYSSDVKSAPRVNFNLAHELGHLILHSGVEVTSGNIARIERQANRFAGAFLLPRTSFPTEVISTSVAYFQSLKSRWRVAISAMIYRCKDLSILTDSQVKYLWRQMNILGIRKVEPLDFDFEISSPKVLLASLEMLISRGVQVKEEIHEQINLNPKDIESLIGAEPGWFSMGKVVQFVLKSRI